jgi:Protein of unknown function (DUF3984)
MQRTGAALASETRESKGQSWLVSRASSTSLVREGEDELAHAYVADDELSLTPGRRSSRAYSGEFSLDELGALQEDSIAEVEEEEEEDIDIPGGFGLGQFVDRLIGWSVFAEDDTDDEESLDGYEEEIAAKLPGERAKSEAIQDEKLKKQRRLRDGEEGWEDSAWLFGVVTNVLF